MRQQLQFGDSKDELAVLGSNAIGHADRREAMDRL
jgi:hypothetical protein